MLIGMPSPAPRSLRPAALALLAAAGGLGCANSLEGDFPFPCAEDGKCPEHWWCRPSDFVCFRECDSVNTCADGWECLASLGTCAKRCDAVGNAQCPAGFDCKAFDDAGALRLACVDYGSVRVGAPCANADDCALGSTCWGAAFPICTALCDGSTSCAGGVACSSLGASLGLCR